jgi:adenylate kinase family enzyme
MIIGVFGVPCVGKGSVIEALQASLLDRYRCAVISSSSVVKDLLTDEDKTAMAAGGLFPREDELRTVLHGLIDDWYAFGADIILLDGFPRFDDQLRWLRQMWYQQEIQMVQILGPDDMTLVRRASKRARDTFDTDPKLAEGRILTQRKLISGLEHMIQQYGLHYTSVINYTVANAAKELERKLRLPKVRRESTKPDVSEED